MNGRMNAAERREYQRQLEADWNRQQEQRMHETAPVMPKPGDVAYCAPNMRGHRHDFSMKGNDGIRRCWHCCAKKATVAA